MYGTAPTREWGHGRFQERRASAAPVNVSFHAALLRKWSTMKSILDPSFRYTASFNTDLRKTFARIRLSHRTAAQQATGVTPARRPVNVSPIIRAHGSGAR